ncbi:hypothetical protein [Bradyrhizobium sp. JYMT SZCCT0428]|uniref:hypothetical protein n=1 Tax=Bradyrhizobium sp. JYMT SZCCT0428 TaxID=2807673 RepID=UPI001BAAA197|nr:hypothetical protein [Bradyrhizobium sp. JYMT SZCCT0428]MBR1150076.1 hypothetical protein [Bradyrhizobium sp. JYMT SZCCT0428]
MATANISNRISLDGGDDVRQQVVGFAEEFNKLLEGVQRVADQLGRIDASRLETVQGQLAGASQAAGQASGQVQSFGSDLLSFAGKTVAGIAGLAVAVSAVISSIASSAAETTSALDSAASKVGLTVQTYQALKQGADDAGISVEGLNRILGNIDKAATQAAGSLSQVIPTDTAGRLAATGSSLEQIAGGLAVAQRSADAFGRTAGSSIDLIQKFGDATVTIFNGVSKSALDLAKSSDSIRQGARGAAEALSQLGISADLLSKLTPEQRLQLLAMQLDKIPESAGKAAIAARLFGDEWRKALEFIKQLPQTLGDSDGSLRSFSDGEIAAGKRLKDSLGELSAAFTFLKDKIGLLFAAGQSARAEWLTKLIDDARKLLFGFIAVDEAKQKLLASGQFDFFRDLDLDKFQEFLNQKGESGLAQAIGFLRDVSRDLAQVWSSVLIPAGLALIAAFNGIAAQINSAFGTDISGRFVAIVAVIGLVTGAFGALRAVFSPVVAAFGALLSSIGSIGPLLLAGALAVRAFWAEFRGAGSAAIGAVRSESAGFLAAFSQLARGNFSGAWALFKSAALDAFASVKDSLGKIFGGEGSTVFTSITRLISGIALAASGLAAIFNAIFGTNVNAEGLLLVAVLAQLFGAFTLLAGVGRIVALALLPLGASFLAIAASAIILARQFPDLGKSWEQVTQGFSNLLAGDFDKAITSFGAAFDGVWSSLKNQGVLTWTILGAGALAVSAAVGGLIGQIRTLATILIAITPILAALGSAGLIANDLTKGLGPLEEFENMVKALNSQFRDGKISAEEYNKQMEALHSSSDKAKDASGGATKGFADSWKAALDQIKAVLGETGANSKQVADGIAPPFNAAADKIAGGFKSSADKSFNGFREIAPGIWSKIQEGGKTAADGVAGGFKNAADGSFNGFREVSKGVFQKIPQDAKASADESKSIFDGLEKAIADTIRATPPFELKGSDKATEDLSSVQQGIQNLGQSSDDLTPRLNAAFAALQSGGSSAASQAQATASSVQAIAPAVDGASSSARGLGSAFDGVGSSGASGLSSVASSLDGVIGKLSQATSGAQALAAAIASVNSGSGGGEDLGGFAGGGYTGSGGVYEPAGIVHKGEYVQPAHVVRQPGVLALMEMLRAAGGDLRQALANFGFVPRGFSFGGLVDSMSRQLSFESPRLSYAGGGIVNPPAPLRPVTLQFGSGENARIVSGLHASPQRVQELEKEALFDRLRSSRTPSRGSSRG